MNKQEFLDKVAELAMQYKESNGNCAIGVEIRVAETPLYTKNKSFKCDVYSFDGKYMELVDGATNIDYVFGD